MCHFQIAYKTIPHNDQNNQLVNSQLANLAIYLIILIET